ncbi:MAG: hypothetical protein V4541_07520 [Bacteroidota bacterium]
MIEIEVAIEDILIAKQQVSAFEKTDAGSWRYTDVEAWRGIVCEMMVSRWFESNYKVEIPSKGLDTSGNVDDYDFVLGGKKFEIKSATKNYFKFIMPKIHDVDSHPKDFYIAAKYNETVEPNKVYLLGYLTGAEINKFPKKQNKGAPYYEVPISEFRDIEGLKLLFEWQK